MSARPVLLQDLKLTLLNDWQHGFPLQPRPYLHLARQLGVSEAVVMQAYAALAHDGSLSRIGGVWGAGAGGAAQLCAMAVPADRLQAVAERVNAEPGVNHNYQREHDYNLWFVITGPDAPQLERRMQAIERDCRLPALRLRMVRPYRIDLGFDLRRGSLSPDAPRASRRGQPVGPDDRALAAQVERGLPLVEQPYAQWAQACGRSEADVLARLQGWLPHGTLRRFGTIVRHHDVGFDANAMTVFDVDDAQVDAFGERLASQSGITLCYRRERAPTWRYNLYCMVHGRDRGSVEQCVRQAIAAAGLGDVPQAMLFSTRRFKQTGGRYFSLPADERPAWAAPQAARTAQAWPAATASALP